VDPETLELTAEEKNMWHKKQFIAVTPDLSQATLAKFYSSFTLPEKAEGFDDVKYVWQPQSECAKRLKGWIHERKLTQRVDDLEPGEWFRSNLSKWTKTLSDWKQKQQQWKDPAKKKALLAKRKEAKKKGAEATQAEGEEEGEEPAEEEEDEPIVAADIDVFGVEDVTDIGSGEPLFANFAYEDWALTALRVEFHLMLHSWKKDLDDSERPSFKEKDLAFYYNKYFKKQFVLKNFNVESFTDFIDFIEDSVVIEDTGFLGAQLDDDDVPFGEFLKLAEEHRRNRGYRVDAGDESAILKFTRPAPAAPKPATATPTHVAIGGTKRLAPASAFGPASKMARPAPAYGGMQPMGRPGFGQQAGVGRVGLYPSGAYGAPAAHVPQYGGAMMPSAYGGYYRNM